MATTRTLVAIGLAAGLLSARPAVSAEIEGVDFADRLNVGATELSLHGTGLLRYRMLFKGYVAALYLEGSFGGSKTSTSVLADVPRRLEIEYFWPIEAEKLAEATLEGISRGTDARTLESLRGPIQQISMLYENVEPGDRYAITYIPDVGTELAFNGRPLGIVEGADFSSALFSIWIGDKALDESLSRQLLSSG